MVVLVVRPITTTCLIMEISMDILTTSTVMVHLRTIRILGSVPLHFQVPMLNRSYIYVRNFAKVSDFTSLKRFESLYYFCIWYLSAVFECLLFVSNVDSKFTNNMGTWCPIFDVFVGYLGYC